MTGAGGKPGRVRRHGLEEKIRPWPRLLAGFLSRRGKVDPAGHQGKARDDVPGVAWARLVPGRGLIPAGGGGAHLPFAALQGP